jgi:hypothetical protein
MTRTRLRQVARLEKLVQPYLERKQEQHSHMAGFMRNFAFRKLANLALLILHGDPKIDQPLSAAWQRCRESAAWKGCLNKHPDFGDYGRYEDYYTPFTRLGEMYIAAYFSRYFLPNIRGADVTDKLDVIFETAPPWLLWFTYGDVYACIFGVKTPNLSSVNHFMRGDSLWSELPQGPFECRPFPDGAYDKFTTRHESVEDKTADMTPRERKRALRIHERNK